MIIQEAGDFSSEFFSSIPKEVKNVKKYYSSIQGLHGLIKQPFPLLKMVCLPTKVITTAYIQGILLPDYAIKEMHLLPEQYEQYGLPIFANIPEDFQSSGIQVYDACKRINWDEIPIEIMHCLNQTDRERDYGIRRICTHKSEYITENNCVLNVLYNAYYLFQEYSRYDGCGKFELDCLPHGDKKLTRGEKRIEQRRIRAARVS